MWIRVLAWEDLFKVFFLDVFKVFVDAQKKPFTIKIGSQMGHVLGIKNQKGTVSVENFNNSLVI
jgi:hypothetical protein